MTIDDELKKKIAGIINGLQCSEDFRCYSSLYKDLCKAKSYGTESQLLLCLEEHPKKCKFLNLAAGYVCECPLRRYIAKRLEE
jgi:hypothetical protein